VLQVSALIVLLAGAPEPGGAMTCAGEVTEVAREEARRLLEAAQAQQSSGEWARAEESMRQAARLDPASPFPHYALGTAMMDRQRFPEAVSAFARCREVFRCLRDADASARERFRGRLEGEIQQLRAAVAELERQRLKRSAIPWQEMNGSDPQSLGGSTQAMHELERRLAELQLLRRHPDREPAGLAFALGNAHFMTNDLEAAEREFRNALDIEPGNGDAHHNLGIVFLAQDRLPEAEREMKAAAKAGIEIAPRLKDEIHARKKSAARP
jgi:tetratricopeptide (TPR) repeat protein